MSIIGGIIATSMLLASLEKSSKLDKKAREKLAKAYDRQCEAEEIAERKKLETDNAMIKLANIKRAMLTGSVKDFIELYSVIKKLNFVETEGIKELEKKLMLSNDVDVMKKMFLTTVNAVSMTDSDTIKAFLMGGLLGAATVTESKRELSIANNQMRVANVIYSQAQTLETALNGIIDRCNNFGSLLVKINLIFIKAIKNCSVIIEEKQDNKELYTEQDRKALMTCMNIASAIKKLIDVPIIDKDGIITQKSFEALQMGKEYLNIIYKN